MCEVKDILVSLNEAVPTCMGEDILLSLFPGRGRDADETLCDAVTKARRHQALDNGSSGASPLSKQGL